MCKERQEGKERKRIRKIERGIQRESKGKIERGETERNSQNVS